MPITAEHLAEAVQKYVEAASRFDNYYRSQGDLDPNSPTEREIETMLDEASAAFEAALAQAPRKLLIEVIMSLGSNFADLTTPEGQERVRDFLRHFNDFESIDEPEFEIATS